MNKVYVNSGGVPTIKIEDKNKNDLYLYLQPNCLPHGAPFRISYVESTEMPKRYLNFKRTKSLKMIPELLYLFNVFYVAEKADNAFSDSKMCIFGDNVRYPFIELGVLYKDLIISSLFNNSFWKYLPSDYNSSDATGIDMNDILTLSRCTLIWMKILVLGREHCDEEELKFYDKLKNNDEKTS